MKTDETETDDVTMSTLVACDLMARSKMPGNALDPGEDPLLAAYAILLDGCLYLRAHLEKFEEAMERASAAPVGQRPFCLTCGLEGDGECGKDHAPDESLGSIARSLRSRLELERASFNGQLDAARAERDQAAVRLDEMRLEETRLKAVLSTALEQRDKAVMVCASWCGFATAKLPEPGEVAILSAAERITELHARAEAAEARCAKIEADLRDAKTLSPSDFVGL